METTNNDPWGVNGQPAADTNGGTTTPQTDSTATTANASTAATATANVPATTNASAAKPADTGKDALGTASLVFGIISLVLGANVWGIIGLVLGCVSNSYKKNGHATAGIICSVISLVFWVILIIALVVVLSIAWPEIQSALSELAY